MTTEELKKLAEDSCPNYTDTVQAGFKDGFQAGFKKALELMDKRHSYIRKDYSGDRVAAVMEAYL